MKVIVVAGTHSGVGKTSIAVGLMAAFRRRGLRVQPFKIGPDFLDPMHHKEAAGTESFNLDGWMLSKESNLSCFLRCAESSDIAIVEGVMGLFDGRDGKSEAGSTAEIAKLLKSPVLLVIDCYSLARSVAAVIHGYLSFDPQLNVGGVIFNKVGSKAHYTWLKEAMDCSSVRTEVMGGVPFSSEMEIKERHLGLSMPNEQLNSSNYIQKLADIMEDNVDLDKILSLAPDVNSALMKGIGKGEGEEGDEDEKNEGEEAGREGGMNGDLMKESGHYLGMNGLPGGKSVRIGIARDDAFCFYYNENLSLLSDAGAELVFFSPMKDTLPPRLDAVYLGGGYPELHALSLSSNTRMLYAVKAFAAAGGIIYAECGGLIYLSKQLQLKDGEIFPMCGVFPFSTRMVSSMKMGYVIVTPKDSCCLFPSSIGDIKGQFYHFSEIVEDINNLNQPTLPDSVEKSYVLRIQTPDAPETEEGYQIDNVIASYVHLHFASNGDTAISFVDYCRKISSKAPAVAAASASAVAEAGPEAAAAAGAAAAAAVTEALNESRMETEEDADLLLRPLTTSFAFHDPNFKLNGSDYRRRRSESWRWERRSSFKSTSSSEMSYLGSLPWELTSTQREGRGRDAGEEGEEDEEDMSAFDYAEYVERAKLALSSSTSSSIQNRMRRSMSEYWNVKERKRVRKQKEGSDGKERKYINGDCSVLSENDLSSLSALKASSSHNLAIINNGESTRKGMNNKLFESQTKEIINGDKSLTSNKRPLNIKHPSNGRVYRRSLSEELRPIPLSSSSPTPTPSPSSSDEGETWELSHSIERLSLSPRHYTKDRLKNEEKNNSLQSFSPSKEGNVSLKMNGNATSCFSENDCMKSAIEMKQALYWVGMEDSSPSPSLPLPQRIVSFLPSATEILMELGVGDRLLGVTDLCDYPEHVYENRHVVSKSRIDFTNLSSQEIQTAIKQISVNKESSFEIDVSWLKKTKPDLIFTQDTCAMCDVDKNEIMKSFQSLDLLSEDAPRVIVLSCHTLSDILDSILLIGQAVGKSQAAHALVESLRSRLRHVNARVAGVSRQRVVSLEGLRPPVLGGHWLPAMKSLAGGGDPLHEAGCRAEKVAWERVVASSPEVLLLCPCSSSPSKTLSEVVHVASLPGFWSLPAVQTGHVYICDHVYFSRPGPRLVSGVEILARVLHPDRVAQIVPPGAVLKLSKLPNQRCRAEDLYKHFLPYL